MNFYNFNFLLEVVVIFIVIVISVLIFKSLRGFTMETIESMTNENSGKTDKTEKTIFISIASYRDSQCQNTINEIFKKAKNPERIFIGICEQNEIGNVTDQCINFNDGYISKYKNQIRKVEFSHLEATGPCLARYFCSLLFRGEDYFLQIDSHSLFLQDWDEILINMYNECDVKNAVFGGYPKSYEEYQNNPDNYDVPVSCHFHFDNNEKMPELFAIQKTAVQGEFTPVPYTGAGFMFGPGKMLIDVPFDPELPYLFMGEELLYSARLYTAGYNIVIPYKSVIFHDYGRPGAPRFWDEEHLDYDETYAEVKKKLFYLLKFSTEKPAKMKIDPKYGMGNKRTIQQYYEWARVDNVNRIIRSKDKFCL